MNTTIFEAYGMPVEFLKIAALTDESTSENFAMCLFFFAESTESTRAHPSLKCRSD